MVGLMTEAELSEFVRSMAHDLRTPLTSVRGFTDILIRGGDRLSDEDRMDYLQRIRAAAERLDGLIAELSARASGESA
jgi:signal transduction histidine kinase